MTAKEGVPKGTVTEITMKSDRQQDLSRHRARAKNIRHADPTNPYKLDVTTSHPAPYTRKCRVYVPKQYVPGTAAPFIVGADGSTRSLFTALDNLIAEQACR